jgi:hypothetical protein
MNTKDLAQRPQGIAGDGGPTGKAGESPALEGLARGAGRGSSHPSCDSRWSARTGCHLSRTHTWILEPLKIFSKLRSKAQSTDSSFRELTL